MTLSDFWFLGYFIIYFGISIILKRWKFVYKIWLVIGSVAFLVPFGINFLGILFSAILVNYLVGYLANFFASNSSNNRLLLRLGLGENKLFGKIILVTGIIANIALLAYFKYTNFFLDTLLEFSQNFSLNWQIPIVQIIAPVGLSFLVFRFISHLVEFSKSSDFPNILDFALFLIFFPYFVAGPIVSPKNFYRQLKTLDSNKYDQNEVAVLIIGGLFKKLVISSYLYGFFDNIFDNPRGYSTTDLLLSALIFGCYLYNDFSGYSDLAIGFSKLLGFNFEKNFNEPYSAKSFSEFWSKWHISLTKWLGSHVYIPLGGDGRNAKKFKFLTQIRNVFLVMLISGIWHGAGWNFIIWGGIHGLLLVIEIGFLKISIGTKFVGLLPKNLHTFLQVVGSFFSWLWVFSAVTLLWIPFRISTFETLKIYFEMLNKNLGLTSVLLDWRIYALILVTLLINFYGQKLANIFQTFFNKTPFILKIGVFCLLGYLILMLSPELIPPFVYAGF